MHVVVVGGSLVGLMHGIMFKHHGYDVDILEQLPQRLEGQAAGVATGMHVKGFLDAHDRIEAAFAFPTNGVRVFDGEDKVQADMRVPGAMTSWDALYYRLRANFDALSSVYVSSPPEAKDGDGKASYQTGKKVVAIDSTDGGRQVSVSYEDFSSGKVDTIVADLVIAADGSNSTVRKLLSPSFGGRRYAGYVLWRGLVPEKAISAETTSRSSNWFSFCPVPRKNEVAVLYPIPGKTGSLKDGEREMNFAWYAHITPDELAKALTDVDGHKHNWSVPLGKMDPGVWQKQLRRAEESLSPSCIELASKIEKPFLQVIGDFTAPQATFLEGRVLVTGDALATLRPHTGAGISSGAYHVLELERVIFKRREDYVRNGHAAAMQEWAKTAIDFSDMERLRSISWGEYYMGGWLRWLPAAAHYHGSLKMRAWKSKLAGLF